MELQSADIYRDGGSLTVDFLRSDGGPLSILLEVTRVPAPGEQRCFGHLHVGSEIQSACEPSSIVSKGSDQERELISALDEWLANPKVSRHATPSALSRVRELRAHIHERRG